MTDMKRCGWVVVRADDSGVSLSLGKCPMLFLSKKSVDEAVTMLNRGQPRPVAKSKRKYYNPEDLK